MPSIAIVILNWNGIKDTLACYDSLKKQSFKDFTTVIIDNGSLDTSVAELSKISDEHTTILYNPSNRGFAGGVNTGIDWAIKNKYDYVALLNNDAVVDTQWLETLVSAAEKNSAGITTSLILHEDGKTIDSTGDFYSIWGIPSPRHRDEPSSAIPDSGWVFGASGGASLYSTSILADIGLFDEDFFAYYEDVDISFRAQLKGYRVFFERDAIVYHKQGATSNKIPGFAVMQAFKNLPLLYIKNVPLGLILPIGVRFYFIYTLMYINAIRRGDGIHATKGVAKSIVLFWTKSLPARFSIQRSKSVSSKYIRSIISADLPPKSSLRRIKNLFRKSKV